MTAAAAAAVLEQPEDMITCMIDGGKTHSIRVYLRENYPDTWTVDRYKEEYPGQPLLSEKGRRAAMKAKEAADRKKNSAAFNPTQPFAFAERSLAEIFGIDKSLAVSSVGNPIMLRVLTDHHIEADAGPAG